jgi:chromosome segregation ATPase
MFQLIDDQGLRQLEQRVASLERERGQVEAEAHRLRMQVQQAREHDLNAEALALNAGKKPAEPTEPVLRAQLEDAERRVEVLQRRLQLAQSATATYVAEHRDELREALIAALGARAHELAEHARAAAQLFGEIMDNQRPLRRELAPPTPVEEATGTGQNTVDFGGIVSRANVYGEPHQRGDVEAVLGYLASLEDRYPEPTPEPVEAGQGAA